MTSYVGANSSHYPYSAVCDIVATFKDGAQEQGTGCFVSANDVLTASHVLWSDDHGGAAVSVKVYPGSDNGAAPYGSFDANHWYFYQIDDKGDHINQPSQEWQDVGIVSLGTREGDVVGTFGMDPNQYSGWYNLTGFPDKYDTNGFERMTNDWGYATEDMNHGVFNYVDIESNPGNSGGPLWYQGADGPYVVGVCSTTGWATDIYKAYNQILDWIHADGVW
jgi:V8-like Glu-specific endopeptidase